MSAKSRQTFQAALIYIIDALNANWNNKHSADLSLSANERSVKKQREEWLATLVHESIPVLE